MTATGQLTQDIPVLKRLTGLYGEQCECFRSYLDVLEKQQSLIVCGNEEGLLASVALEEQLVTEIFSIQKSIDPLEVMCRGESSAVYAADLAALKEQLDDLHDRVKAQLLHNRELLAQRMEHVNSEITILQNNPLAISARRSRFLNAASPSMIDIRG